MASIPPPLSHTPASVQVPAQAHGRYPPFPPNAFLQRYQSSQSAGFFHTQVQSPVSVDATTGGISGPGLLEDDRSSPLFARGNPTQHYFNNSQMDLAGYSQVVPGQKGDSADSQRTDVTIASPSVVVTHQFPSFSQLNTHGSGIPPVTKSSIQEPSPKSTPQKKRSRYDLSILSKPPAFACSRSQALRNSNNSTNSTQQPGYVPGRPMSQNQCFQLVNTPIYNQGGSMMNLSLTDANTLSLKKDLECAMGETLRQLMTALERLQQMRGAVEKDATKLAGILQSDLLLANIEALVRQHAVLPMQVFAEETRVHIKEEMTSIQSEIKKMSKNGEQLHIDTASMIQTLLQQQETLRTTLNNDPERLASMETLITQQTTALRSETNTLSNTISQLAAQLERQTTTLNQIVERNDHMERKMRALEECSHQQADAVRALLETTKTEICETVRQSIESSERNADAQAEKLKQAVLAAIDEMAYRPPPETPMKDELPSVDVARGQLFPPTTPLTIRNIVMNENWDAALENAHIPLQQAPRTPRLTLRRHNSFPGRRPSPASSPRDINEVVIIDAFEDGPKENRGQSHEREQRRNVTVLGDSTVKNGVLNRIVTQVRAEAGRPPVEEIDLTGMEANTSGVNKKRKPDDPPSLSTSSSNASNTLDTSQRAKPQRKRAKPQRYRDLVFADF